MHNVHIGIFDTQPLAAFETGEIAEGNLVLLIRLLRAGTTSPASERAAVRAARTVSYDDLDPIDFEVFQVPLGGDTLEGSA